MDFTQTIDSPVGKLTVSSDGTSVLGLWIEGQAHYGDKLEQGEARGGQPVFKEVRRWLESYFAGKNPGFTPPLAPRGNAFRQMVWKLLLEIPHGQVTTYGELAHRVEALTGKRQSARAVGGAVGYNPVSIIIPCHRVIGAGGNLTGYAGGIGLKIQLLRLEGVNTDKFSLPRPRA
jgi:methylated-DNA-[protein]-cysteine S-methyltransferase